MVCQIVPHLCAHKFLMLRCLFQLTETRAKQNHMLKNIILFLHNMRNQACLCAVIQRVYMVANQINRIHTCVLTARFECAALL